jgi:hypothetical protein
MTLQITSLCLNSYAGLTQEEPHIRYSFNPFKYEVHLRKAQYIFIQVDASNSMKHNAPPLQRPIGT